MITRFLIAVNVIVYVCEVLTGYPGNPRSVFHGFEEYGPAIAAGEWWRAITAAFIHGSILHIGFNMLALYQVGTIVESLAGSYRMALIYATSLLGAGYAVYHFNYGEPTIGASGAIFGLFGALVAIGVRLGSRGRALIGQVIPIILINLFIGFASPGISNAAHIGGLITGFIASLILLPAVRGRWTLQQ